MPLPAVQEHLSCTRCRYDLIGLPLLARCPECGTGVMTTVVCADVPYALRLRALAKPRRIAVGLAFIVGGAVIALSALASPAGVRALYELGGLDPRPAPALELAASLLVLAGMGLSVIGTWMVVPREDRLLRAELTSSEILHWWQRLPMLRIGVAIGFLAAVADLCAEPLALREFLGVRPEGWHLLSLAVFLLGAVVAERALSRLMSVLGRRSRLFLEGAHARQSVDVMVLAGATALMGRAGTTYMHRHEVTEWIIVPRGVWLVGGALLLFSTLYLAANAVWIVRALWVSKAPTKA